MLRWIFLAAGVAAFALMIASGPQLAIFASFGVLFANFATFCLQYNGAADRAQARIAFQLARTPMHSDEHQRLETARATPTSEERQHPMNALTVINYASGAASVAFVVFGLVQILRAQ